MNVATRRTCRGARAAACSAGRTSRRRPCCGPGTTTEKFWGFPVTDRSRTRNGGVGNETPETRTEMTTATRRTWTRQVDRHPAHGRVCRIAWTSPDGAAVEVHRL